MNMVPINPHNTDSSLEDLRSVLRPQGNFRFLSPLDIIADGDLFRACPTDGERDREAPFNYNFTLVNHFDIGKQVREVRSRCAVRRRVSWEFIRPIPDESTTLPLFDIED